MVLATIGPYWTDYISAFGAVVGILVAGGAFVIASRSARDARRSADASEQTAKDAKEQLVLARREHEQLEAERMRRPAIESIRLSSIDPGPGEEDTPQGLFRIEFANTGDRDLQDAVLTILFDRASAAELTDRWGSHDPAQSKDDTRERWPGVEGSPQRFDFFARAVTVQVGVDFVQYVRFPRVGRFPIRVRLFHAALDRRGPWVDRWIDVDDDGKVTVDVVQHDSPRSYEGRAADFDPPATS